MPVTSILARVGLCMAAIVIVQLGTASAVELYVSTVGNDAWSGSRPAPNGDKTDGPFATLARAQAEIRELKAAGQLGKGATVLVRGGTYELAETFTIGPDDSGTAEGLVVYRAYPDEKPVLVGGAEVAGWRPYRDQIMQSDLRGTPLEGVAFRQLFFRGRRMVMARYPNVDADDPHFGTWAHVLAVDGSGVKNHFTCTDDVIKDWTRLQYAEVCIHPAYGWAWNVVPIKAADREQSRIDLGRNVSYDLRIGDRYFVQNLPEELDAPGEWYLDRDTSTLYFWPPEDIRDGDVRAPTIQTVVEMSEASHVTVRGFTIEACDGEAVQLRDCESCTIAASTIRNCGGWGVTVYGGHRSGAFGNDIYATGAGGVDLTGGDRTTLERGDNFATNNYIHHIAEFRRTYHGGVRVGGVGNTADHNLIHDCYHQGIGMTGNDNVVEYNIVHHTNLGSEDTGGLYMSSRNYTVRGNVIRYNVFHHVGGFGKANSWTPVQDGRVEFEYPHFTWGIYLDAPETGVHVYGNMLYSVPICGMFNHSGKDNTWENNIVVDAPGFRASVWGRPDLFETSWKPLREARQQNWPGLARYPELARYDENEPRVNAMFNCKFIRNIIYYTEEGGRWLRERNSGPWEGGQLVWTYRGHRDDFPEFEFDRNVVYAPPGVEAKFELTLEPAGRELLNWDEWRATGKDEHSVFEDPLFVDPANHDYRLKPASPALKLGFQPIPFEEIGPYKHELRASWPIVEAPGAAALGDFTTERYFQLPGYEPVDAKEIAPRQGIARFFQRVQDGEAVTVVCFAGGNHAQGGWFRGFIDDLQGRYPAAELKAVEARIHGGARGSPFSVFRFGHEVLRHRPDLIFIDFASDDAESNQERIWPAAEGVVRQAWRADPATDLVLVYAFRMGYEEAYAEGMSPAAVSAYEKLADHYGIPSINLGYRIAQLAAGGELVLRATAEEAKALGGKPVFTHDGVYATEAANQLYAKVMSEDLAQLGEAGVADPTAARVAALEKPFRSGHLERARQVAIIPAMLNGDWERLEPGAFGQHFDEIWFTRTPGARLTFRFKGTEASIFDLMGPDTGRVRVTIDGEDKGERQQVDRWCYYQRLSALSLAGGLEDAEHTVTVELLPEPPDRTEPIEEAKRLGQLKPEEFEGVALQFGCIRIVGEPVE